MNLMRASNPLQGSISDGSRRDPPWPGYFLRRHAGNPHFEPEAVARRAGYPLNCSSGVLLTRGLPETPTVN